MVIKPPDDFPFTVIVFPFKSNVTFLPDAIETAVLSVTFLSTFIVPEDVIDAFALASVA